jgi:hypothetical protein
LIGPILGVYGDAGFIVLVGVAMGLIVILLYRASRPTPDPHVEFDTPLRRIAPCGKCDGTGRYVDVDGHDWPCLEPIHLRFQEWIDPCEPTDEAA